MDDRERVAAIRAGDPRGLASTFDAYGDALFAFCHAMLRERACAEDAVQDTFVVLAERVDQLRDAGRLRPWLYAVARTQCLHQLRSARRVTVTDQVADMMDESVDLDAELHNAHLQDLVWQAAAGLNTGERAALELSLRHGLEGADLAAALDVSRGTCNKLMQRAREELERGLAALLVAGNEHGCADLGAIVEGWDGQLTVLMRKRLSRHIEQCEACGAQKRHRVSAAALLGAIPLLAAPAALKGRVIDTAMRDVSYNRTVVRRAGWFDRDGFPSQRTPHRRAVGAALAVAGAVVIALLLAVVPAQSRRVGFQAFGPSPSTSASLPAPATSAASSARPPARSATSRPPSSVLPLPTSPVTTPASAPPSTPDRKLPKPPPKPSTSQPAPALSVSPTKVDLSTGKASVTILASNGSIIWTAKTPAYIGFSPASATVPTGTSAPVELYLTGSYPKSGSATVYFTWPGGSTPLQVGWST